MYTPYASEVEIMSCGAFTCTQDGSITCRAATIPSVMLTPTRLATVPTTSSFTPFRMRAPPLCARVNGSYPGGTF